MKNDLDGRAIQLKKDELISLPDANGSTVAVLWGSVWLTQDGKPRDYELNAGDSFTVRDDARVVVSAFENAGVSILLPCNTNEGRTDEVASVINRFGSVLGRTFAKVRAYVLAT